MTDHIPFDLHRTNVRFTTEDPARNAAAIELAEAYRAITINNVQDPGGTALVDRLVAAAEAWEKIR